MSLQRISSSLRRSCLQLLVLLWAASFAWIPVHGQEDDWQGVERIVVVGDLHGDYDNYIKVLRQADLINRRGRWIGETTHLVQLGDVPDRGPDTAKIIKHLMKLEAQADKAGGRVHVLIGNHDAMNMTGDLRYVHPGEYAALKSRNAKRLRDGYLARVLAYYAENDGLPEPEEVFRENWLARHPLGFVEHRQHWSVDGPFGAWTVGHNAVLRINRTLFVHAGLSPAYQQHSIRDLNEQIRSELRVSAPEQRLMLEDENGPLWYRGLSARDESEEIEIQLTALLAAFDVDRIVVGHTPGFGTVVPKYGSRVLVADSGISAHYGGYLASLLIEGDSLTTVQRGERIPVPRNRDGLLSYYRAVAALEPDMNNLTWMIEQLENPPETIQEPVETPEEPVETPVQ